MTRCLRISVCLITRNEEKNLERCLRSLGEVDEIVIVDSGSTDGTADLARRFGARFVARPFNDYADQKNYALSLGRGEWVFSIDADEVMSPGLREEINEALSDSRFQGWRIPRRSHIFGRVFRWTGTRNDRPLRLFRRSSGRFEGSIHETVRIQGKVGNLQHFLEHYTYDSLKQYLERFNRYTSAEALRFVEEKRPLSLFDLALKPILQFLNLFFLKQGFRDGFEGFIFSVLSGFYVFVKHAKYFETVKIHPRGGNFHPNFHPGGGIGFKE